MVKLVEVPESSQDELAEGGLYEVVNGQRVERTMGLIEGATMAETAHTLQAFCREQELGRVLPECLFRIPGRENIRQPDVAYVSYDRWAKDRGIPRVNAWPIAPDLAVEVVSPTDKLTDVLAKVEEYFVGGVRMVWLVIPILKIAYLYSSATEVRIITANEDLTGEPVLPGFRVNLGSLLPKVEESPPSTPA